jgi:predicted LPLAT superfamily acyltransferase
MAQDQTELSCDQVGACVVIPVYNHASTVGSVVRGALEQASAVLVCDDGSTDGSGERAEQAGGVVLHHTTNRGKGAALQTLFKEASRRGFRYAISLDADGQHLPADLPSVAKRLREEPGALFIGARNLRGARAPASSEFGRKFSNFWVWFESGWRVDDSQCGYRAYPLPETLQLATNRHRYDFEVEVLLRSAWAGLALRSVPVGVLYPEDRVTHFRPFADNARISLLNLLSCIRLLLPVPLSKRLRRIPRRPGLSLFELRRWAWLGGEGPFWRLLAAGAGILASTAVIPGGLLVVSLACAFTGFGALPAIAASYGQRFLTSSGLPTLASAAIVAGAMLALGVFEARRALMPGAPKRWTGRSRGGVFGHWFFFQLIRFFGVRAAYAVIYPVSLYFLFAASTARNASRQFLDRAMGQTHLFGRLLRTYRHFLSFARTLVDRALLATRGKSAFRCEEIGLDYIRSSAAEGRGAILLTAHLGNWDLAAGVLDGEVAEKLAIVAFRGERERIAKFFEKNLRRSPRIIEVGAGPLASLEMVRALRDGSVLAVQGDRPIDNNIVKIPFLGQDAPFPVGPFMLAAVTGAPVLATFSIQIAPASYRFFAQPPMRVAFTSGPDRETQLRTWVGSYVHQLEQLARQHPYQWFNFYSFWDSEPTGNLKS